jgi:Co/Zn/Cd efflux system component
MAQAIDDEGRLYRRIIWVITLCVLAICVVEVAAALRVDSRFLLRDGLEWGYDVAIFGLAAATFGRGASVERWSGFALAAILAAAGLQTAWQIWRTFIDPPEVEAAAVTISAALIVLESWAVVLALVRFRASHNPVIEATWLSARNDAVTGTLYALVTLAARLAPMIWPQMFVDTLGMILAFVAAWQVARDARAGQGDHEKKRAASDHGAS